MNKLNVIFIIPLVIALLAVFTISPFAMWQASTEESVVPNAGFVVPEFILQDDDYLEQYYKPQAIQTFTPSLSEAIYDATEQDISSSNIVDVQYTEVNQPGNSGLYNQVTEYIGYNYNVGRTPEIYYRMYINRHDNTGQYGTFRINFNQVTLPSEYDGDFRWFILFDQYTLRDATSVSLNIKGYNIRENGSSNINQTTITDGVVSNNIVDIAFLADNAVGLGYGAYDISLVVEFDYTNEIQFTVFNTVRETTSEDGNYNIYRSDVEPFSARMINITEVSYADFNLLSWLGTALDGFANTPLFVLGQAPDTFTVTMGGLLAVTLALPLFIAFLKKFAGG